MMINKLLPTITFCLIWLLGNAQVVTNQSQLNNAINTATPGTTIMLANSTWNNVFINIDKNGTSSAPITITAQNPGAVLMTGNSRVYMEGAYLTVSGLIFQDPSNLVLDGSSTIEPVIELKNCNNCKIINNKIDSYNGTEAQKAFKFKWILTDGQNNEIAYNSFIGKYGVGSIINDNRNSTEPDYLKIHHNYFADRTPINGLNEDNDQDAIRIGNSSTSLSDSFSEVYENYFFNFFGEVEIISNKSGQNKYYNNTFRNFAGCLTLRHGNNCEVYGNYFFAEGNPFTAGVRVIGEGHKVYNNYIEGINSFKENGSFSNVTGGINVTNGRLNSALNGYYQVKNVQIINNTFVNCDYALRIGTTVNNDLDQAPQNLTIANNITYNTSISNYQLVTAPIGASVIQGNIFNLEDTEMADDGNFHRLTSGSSPIDEGVGNYDFLIKDLLGGNRESDFDAGAEEFGANGTHLPYTAADVDLNVGFGAIAVSEPTLAVAPSTLTFNLEGGELSFEVISNLAWNITENLSWLSLNITSGSETSIVTATVDENTSGAERTGTITINEVAGGNGLSTNLAIVQTNSFVPNEIQIVGTTSEGTQDIPTVSEENAYNDDITNYWTGNPDTEPEVSITFDLDCIHELTKIGINFWKADERTITFSIAVANEAAGPFTTILDMETSAASGVTVATEQLFSLAGTLARYVKFIGIGNSSSTNWTSIANVNIYGNPECETTTAIDNAQLIDHGVTLFPVPVTEGILSIRSDRHPLNTIEIFNLAGQKVLTEKGNRLNKKQINITNLASGVYLIRLEKIGQGKFLVE